MARSSICWVSIARLPTSSKNSVPPSVSWKYPFLALSAPVKAPLTYPKNVDGASYAESEPQSTATKGLPERLLFSCRWWAICSLPVPFSPSISTLISVAATNFIASLWLGMPSRHARTRASGSAWDSPISSKSLIFSYVSQFLKSSPLISQRDTFRVLRATLWLLVDAKVILFF